MSIKRIAAILSALLLLLAAVPVFAFGDTGWKSNLLRMNDLSDVMQQEDIDELNSRACGAVEQYKFDFVLITFRSDMRADGDTDAEYVKYLYTNNGLGYGENSDGVLMAVNTDTNYFVLESFGRGTQIFDDDAFTETASAANSAFVTGGLKDAFSAFLDEATGIVSVSSVIYDPEAAFPGAEVNTYVSSFGTGPETPGSGSSAMPAWYPENKDAWVFTPAAADAPRVVDDADILTDFEEQRLEQRIKEVAPRYATDIVIFTDTSTHGLERRVYAADFYDFNGYGVGADHDGFCLFICMDPNARGGWCCVTGERSRSLYTEESANKLDDVLYPYLGRGEYFDGIYDWIGNIGGLLDKGIPFAPEWFPSIANGEFVRRHDENAPRVLDEAGVIEAEEEAKLLEKINAIKEKYGVDVLVFTARDTYGMDELGYIDAVYKYKGYGLGENYDGVALGIFPNDDSVEIRAYGSAQDKLNLTNIDRLRDAAGSRTDVGDYYGSANRWLDYLDTTLRTGRTPRTPIIWVIRSAISGVVGLIAGAVRTSSAKRTMTTVRTAYSANDHLVTDSCRMQNAGDQFVRNDITRVYSPRRTDNDRGSSSGGHSSYSGGYSGSSGSSHSGSGRDF